jgi:hypothetical protein
MVSELPYPGRRAPRRFLVIVKGVARAWVCLRLGAALSDSARQCAACGGAGVHSGEWSVCVHWFPRRALCCAGSLGARGRWAGIRHACAGLDAPWGGFAELAAFAWCLNCPILAGALRVGFW